MKQSTANAFGALGYSSAIVQWFWSILAISLPLFTNDTAKQFFLPQKDSSRQIEVPSITMPSQLETIIVVLSVTFAIGLTIYALIALPKTVGKGGKKITEKTAKATLPHVAHKKKLSKKQKRRLIERITWTVKLLMVLLPALALLIPPAAELGLPHAVVAGAGLIFASVSLISFGLQFALVKLWRIPSNQVW